LRWPYGRFPLGVATDIAPPLTLIITCRAGGGWNPLYYKRTANTRHLFVDNDNYPSEWGTESVARVGY
jgi:hypothetical protein